MSRTVLLQRAEKLQGDNALDSEFFGNEGPSFFDPWLEKSCPKDIKSFIDNPLDGLDFTSWIEEADLPSFVNSSTSFPDESAISVASTATDLDDALGEVFGEFELEPPSSDVCNLDEVVLESRLPFSEANLFAAADVLVEGESSFAGVINPDEVLGQGNSSKPSGLFSEFVLECGDVGSPLSDSGVSSSSSSSSSELTDSDSNMMFLLDLLDDTNSDFVAECNEAMVASPSFGDRAISISRLALPTASSSRPETVTFDLAVLQALTSGLGQIKSGFDGHTTSPGAKSRSRKRPAVDSEKSVAPRRRRTDEQKKRKMRQNRDAAIRYRERKKGEMATMFCEADELEEANKKLRDRVDGLSKEIDYLKVLMLDVIKARLAKSSSPLLSLLSPEMLTGVLATS